MLNYDWVSTREVDCPLCRRTSQESEGVITVPDYLNISTKQYFNYHKCFCGVYFLANQPNPDQISKIYSEKYAAYIAKNSLVSRIKKNRMRSTVKPLLINEFQTKILDYGCGSGEFIDAICDLVDSPIVGYDIIPINYFHKSNSILVNSRAELIDLGPFDLVFSFQVIEHLVDPLEFLNFLNSVMKDSGRIVLETPSSSGFLFSKFIRKFWGGWHAPRHFVIFDKDSIFRLVKSAGFIVESFEYIPSPFQWIESIRPLIPPKSKINQYLNLNNFILVSIFYVFDRFLILLKFKTSNMRIVLVKK